MRFKITEYDKNILKVFSGTAMAQAIAFLVVPLIAKQYGPGEYGVYAGFLASVTILSTLSTGKYELAIMLPEQKEKVFDLMRLSNLINLITCIAIAVAIGFTPLSILNWALGINAKDKFIFIIIPVATFLLASFQILNYWLIRERRFSLLSFNKVLRSLLFGVLALCFGAYWPQSLFLALALTLGHLFSNIFLRIRAAPILKSGNIGSWLLPERKKLKEVGKQYIRFPKYILPSEFMNAVCSQLPVFVFLWAFGPVESGYFSFILTVLNIPISLLAGAILDVFKEQASKDYREKGNCRVTYLSTLKKMTVMSLLPFLLLYLFGNNIITLLFGEKWAPAGKFLDILLIMFFLKFISSPLSFVFYIVHKQREDFMWHIYILITTFSTLYIGAVVYKNIFLTVKLYTINFSLIYIIYLMRSFQLSKYKPAS